MTDRDEIDALAGEFVVGTLSSEERAMVGHRRANEPALDAAIKDWERRLSPFDGLVTPVAPSAGLLARIEAQIGGDEASTATVINLNRRLRFWRLTAAMTSAMAASLIAIFVMREVTPPQKPKTLVAVLQKDAQSPAFLVSVDIDNKLMTVRPVAAKHEAGKSYELWLIHDSLGKPKSLGVIDNPAVIAPAQLASYQKSVIESATLAVSLEPEGGSPTGDPTGPVVFAGKMIEGAF